MESALRDAVRGGRLAAGTVLPSSRALAAELGLARNTVADAYGQLVAEGWLTARQGSGTRVAERADPAAPAIVAAAADVRAPACATTSGPASPTWPGSRAPPGWPRPAGPWPRAERPVRLPRSARAPAACAQTLASYLARVRGVRATPDQIVDLLRVRAGAQPAGQHAAPAGGARTLAMESHGLGLHRELARAAGLTTRLVTVDALGRARGRVR